MNGNDHDREDDARRDSMPMPTGGPENSAPRTGTPPNERLQRLLHVGRRGAGRTPAGPTCRRRWTAPRRAARSRCRAGACSQRRRQLGEEQRDAEADRHGDEQRDERGHQRAVDHHQAAELVLHRVPLAGARGSRGRTSRIAGAAPMTSETMMPASSASVSSAAPRARPAEQPCRPRRGASCAAARPRRVGARSLRSCCDAGRAAARSCAGKCCTARSARVSGRHASAIARSLAGDGLAGRVLDARRPRLARSASLTAVGQRHVVELVGHLVAVLVGPVEELQHVRRACAGLSCALCIRMKVAPVIGQASLPGWSVSTW